VTHNSQQALVKETHWDGHHIQYSVASLSIEHRLKESVNAVLAAEALANVLVAEVLAKGSRWDVVFHQSRRSIWRCQAMLR
jgi:hypothetical protein